MPDTTELEIHLIQMDPDIQPRESLDEGILEVFREMYREEGSGALPAVDVFHDADDVFWLADGFYRLTAARDALSMDEPRMLPAIIHEGSRRDAIFFATGANGKHGTQLTAQEKRSVVERLLRDNDWRKLGDRTIARHVGVSNSFVSGIHNEIRAETESVLGEQIPPTETIEVKRNDQTYLMKEGNIGRGNRSKAKKTTTTTMPADPTISQEVPDTDDDEERNTNDDREVVEAITATSFNDVQDAHESDEHQEPVTTERFLYLRAGWKSATDEDRFVFLTWVKTDQDQQRWHEAAASALKTLNMTRDPKR